MAASPVTQANVARESMTVRKMYEAIMYRNNNAAANLLMRRAGGPASLPTLLRSIGDRVTRIDDYEGARNRTPPSRRQLGIPRDHRNSSPDHLKPCAAHRGETAVGKLDGGQHRSSIAVACQLTQHLDRRRPDRHT
jgi:hypothetical protein